MRRREFIAFIGAVSILPRAARSQQSTKAYRIAIVHPSHPVGELTERSRFGYYREFFANFASAGMSRDIIWSSNVSRAKGVSRFIPNSLVMFRLATRTLFSRSVFRWSLL